MEGKKNNRRGPKPQRKSKEKEKKSGRQKQQAISGFSTLSQVSGAPLYKAHHSNIPVNPEKNVAEPLHTCPRCGETIQTIADSFFVGGAYVHFDCILKEIREGETLKENQTVSYLGSGSFGVCEKGEDGKFTILKRIEVENKDSVQSMKDYVGSLKQ